MAATIQKILKPTKCRAVDTSGNNNHGHIYSGRALEFDGVSDYLTVPLVEDTTSFTDTEKWTWTAWMYWTGITTTRIVGQDNTTHPNIGMKSASGSMYFEFRDENAKYYRSSGILNSVIQNTWTRWVVVSDGVNIKFYLNGELFHTISDGDTATDTDYNFTTTAMKFTGWGAPYESGGRGNHFDGKMSDGQIWDVAWSASDVLYDYLNPESLALNNGGTSLTESNLKLWYPMQDGHRGQQSYILDGANTGLSSVSYYGGSTVAFASWTAGSGWSVSNGIATGSSTGDMFKNDSATALVDGVTYKATIVVDSYTSGDVKAYAGGSQVNFGITAPGTYSVYITNATTNDIAAINGAAFSGSISSIEFYPVNDKHHATTVFYGDEQITDSKNRDFGSSSDWAVLNIAGGSLTEPSNKLQIVTSTDEENEGAQLAVAELTTPVVGRTYRISAELQQTSGATTPQIGFQFAGTGSSYFNISASAVTYTKDIVATNTTGNLMIFNTSSDSSTTFKVDDISVKEVGAATGWTDADQQLDIPQTALQSYNQLAWFNGHNSVVKVDDHNNYSFGVAPSATANDSAFSISAWINMNEATTFPIVEKYKASHREYRFACGSDDDLALLLYDEDNSGGWIRARTQNVITSHENEWIHVVATYSGNESNTGITLYLNGESLDLSTDNSGTYAGMRNQDGEVWIGASENGGNYANGCITETSIWNKELSQAEIVELYNDGKALNATIHSATANLLSYWRNNGLAEWKDLKNPSVTTFDGTPTNVTETLLLPAGVDASRDSQGFLMNRQKDTNAINLRGDHYVTTESTYNNDYVRVRNTMSFAEDGFTLAFWVKFTDLGGRGITGMNDGSNHRMYIGQTAVGSRTILFGCGSNYNSVINAVTLNEWAHLAQTWDGTNQKLYVDGVYKATHTTGQSGPGATIAFSGVSTEEFGIGGFSSWPANGAHHYVVRGFIDDILIYDRALDNGSVSIDADAKGGIGRIYNAGKRSHR